MTGTDIVGYGYDGAIHCIACTIHKFPGLDKMPQEAPEKEVTEVFEGIETSYMIFCGTCDAEIETIVLYCYLCEQIPKECKC